MPRRKITNATADSFAAEQPASELVNGEEHKSAGARPLSELPNDPRELKTATLGASNGSPKLRLLRSHQYKQMQIKFDEDPGDQYKDMLKKEGWRDRTEEEGICTKQLPKEGEKWRAVADAERLFGDIANGIRADKGLGSVLSM